MSPENIDVKMAIAELDHIVFLLGEKYTLYICGGAALIFLGYEGRGTGDVDVILENFDPSLRKAVNEVSVRLKIPVDFMDILWLKPSIKELEIAKEYTLKQNAAEYYAVYVNFYLKELFNELGYK